MSKIWDVLVKVFDYINTKYLSMDLTDYKYIQIGSYGTTLGQIIGGLMIGCAIAGLIYVAQKKQYGRFVSLLQQKEAFSSDKACTFNTIGLKPNAYLKNALRNPFSVIRKTVTYIGAVNYHDYENQTVKNRISKGKFKEDIDFDKCEFYIPEELKYRSEIRYTTKGSNWKIAILWSIISIVAIVLIIKGMPRYLKLLDDTISAIAG